ncbi:C4-dicarboxylate ABC transporter [Sphaerisporangium krabiense]|uniref:C4-dicarboxylate transporter/malic acid transport protein n=1 Tax=Sphaerisporangium krabiense TaxID=763782 RepID=A0A7W8Z8X8_9ACTN|nr:TDT family transporter [Sphaerisporangium krabiense]MBB5629599.1 C4-dicarboxylate transporter/malic acid transport protein [Sphaerisporangium krabiense]GII67258.1 C4-dicarboxylate ABC transporter [Sphaerisporangium krabiense]
MSSVTLLPTRAGHSHGARLPFGLLRELERPADLFRHLGPNWYASVMGTGIVANAAATLPVRVTGMRTAATVVWALSGLLLVTLTAARSVHWRRHRAEARAHAAHPVMAHFWGAPAMALLTVGAGTLTLGRDWIGLPAALAVDVVLWSAGTLLGLVTSVSIPYRMMSRHTFAADAAFGGWLMPVVPPMVSASTGALLVPYATAGQTRLTLVLACYAMFGISAFAALVIITQIWTRLVHHTVGPAAMVPTLWIVLGPLGQSVTAANLLGGVAALALPAPYAAAARAFGLLYGLPTWGFAMAWTALAAAVTARTVREHLPFSLTWWSFTFPLGTCVTGTSALAAITGSVVLQATAVILYACLLAAWLTVAPRTAAAAARGTLFLPAPPAARPSP